MFTLFYFSLCVIAYPVEIFNTNQTIYVAIHDRANYTNAQSTCESILGNLATVTTKTNSDKNAKWIVSQYDSREGCFIQGSKNQLCSTLLSTGKIVQKSCSEKQCFLCQMRTKRLERTVARSIQSLKKKKNYRHLIKRHPTNPKTLPSHPPKQKHSKTHKVT